MFMPLVMLILVAVSCTKYTTPKKVERRLPTGTWKITSFTIGGLSAVEDYKTHTFAFSESGGIAVKAELGFAASGSWSTGLNKNPAILYLSFPPVGGLEYLADDWQVVELQKNLIKLKRNDASADGNLTLQR